MEATQTDLMETKEIILRELEPLLRLTLGDKLIVENYTTTSFLPPGENYGSTILAVDAVIKKEGEMKNENLHMIAKMAPPTEFQRRIFKSSYTFKKEAFMYERLIPYYRNLERDFGIDESELIDVIPKFYALRLSLDPNIDFDDNAVILLENLQTRGYYTGKRHIGVNLDHSRLAIRELARFHALGIAMKHNKPDEYDIIREGSKCPELEKDGFTEYYIPILKQIEKSPITRVYYDRCAAVLKSDKFFDLWLAEPEGVWATIIHKDFWVNNVMFHSDENGHVDDVKFIDFQNYMYSNPIGELLFFLHSSTDEDVREHYLDELTDLYYDTFISVLAKMNCDVAPYNRKSFDAGFLDICEVEFIHLCFMLKMLTIDINKTNLNSSNIEKVMANYEGNEMYIKRLESLVSYFVKRDWI
ncbi:PREDICTED: uncharacterized protein LOC106788184 [Polistes canadensis]|uniref:uncharacterized protein LOC106788184 n=1 Tax=Polistes canadensis TaxID=91411 RepID=UPI0007190339|nr:PREDICTED: uncharacterized protein LOC106788184 [Polistes canadensis]